MTSKSLGFYLLFSCLLSGLLMGACVWGDSEQQVEKKLLTPRLLFLKGSPYELGFQHGQCLKEAVAYNVKRLIDEQFLVKQEHPQIKSFLALLPQVLEHIPQDYIQELKGLADGAQLPYEKVLLLNLFPEMFHCSGFTVKDRVTKNGELYHVRVLDYAIGMSLQDTAVLMIVQPEGKIPFMNVSYAGFIGSVTGMNSQHIAIGEIGGKGYGQYHGLPMPFLLRMILEQANNLEEVREILASKSRTCEYYYVFSDGKTKESIGVYATDQQLQFIKPGTNYALFDSANLPEEGRSQSIHNKIVLDAFQIEKTPYQTLLYKDQQKQKLWGVIYQQPADCLVMTGFCRTQRYPILIQRILANGGNIGVEELQAIIKGEAGLLNNLHTAIFAPTTLEAWIAHAGFRGEPAWSRPYEYFNFSHLLQEAGKGN